MNVLELPLSLPPVARKPVTALLVTIGVRRCVHSSRSTASSLQPVPAEIAFSLALQLTVTDVGVVRAVLGDAAGDADASLPHRDRADRACGPCCACRSGGPGWPGWPGRKRVGGEVAAGERTVQHERPGDGVAGELGSGHVAVLDLRGRHGVRAELSRADGVRSKRSHRRHARTAQRDEQRDARDDHRGRRPVPDQPVH